jgi:hypothetical protein
MNLVFAGNTKVFDGLLISLLSIIEVDKKPLTVYVLTMDLPELDKEYVSISQNDLDFVENELRKINPASRLVRVDARAVFERKLGACKKLGQPLYALCASAASSRRNRCHTRPRSLS